MVQVNTWKRRPKPLFTHMFALSCSWRKLGHSHPIFLHFSPFLHAQKSVLGLAEWMCSKDSWFGGSKRHLCLPHAAGACCAFTSTFFFHFLIFPSLDFRFWSCVVNGPRRPTIWVWMGVVLACTMPINIFWNRFWFPGCFPQFYQFVLGCKPVFGYAQWLGG